jgi:hypothetical protein
MNINAIVFEKFDTTVNGLMSAKIINGQLIFNYKDPNPYYDEEFILELGKDNMKKLADFINKFVREN